MRSRLGSVPAVLAALLVAGLVLRVWMSLAITPAATNLSDSLVYVDMADNSLFADPIRQAGYSIFLRAAHLRLRPDRADDRDPAPARHRDGARPLRRGAPGRRPGVGGGDRGRRGAALDRPGVPRALADERDGVHVRARARDLHGDPGVRGRRRAADRSACGADLVAARDGRRGRVAALDSSRRSPARRDRPALGGARDPGPNDERRTTCERAPSAGCQTELWSRSPRSSW